MANYVIDNNGELRHYGVIGMKWGHRKARLDAARDKRATATTGKAREAAKLEEKKAKKAYKEGTQLTRHQKNVRLGSAIAATLLTSPVGGIAVAALMTSHYRGMNDVKRE